MTETAMSNATSGRLKGKIAVVTAAGQGIGRAVAERFHAEGAEVHASDIKADLFETWRGASGRVLDATDHKAVQVYFEAFGRIDVLVHAVGYVHQGSIEECSSDDWRRSMSISLDSAYSVLSCAIPRMKIHGGSIIPIASVASSIKGFPRRAAYGAAKGGVIGLAKSVAADYLKAGIRCNAVCPGTVASPSLRERVGELALQFGSQEKALESFLLRQPSGRLGTVDEIASVCAFLASDDSSFITGQTVCVDGGITI